MSFGAHSGRRSVRRTRRLRGHRRQGERRDQGVKKRAVDLMKRPRRAVIDAGLLIDATIGWFLLQRDWSGTRSAPEPTFAISRPTRTREPLSIICVAHLHASTYGLAELAAAVEKDLREGQRAEFYETMLRPLLSEPGAPGIRDTIGLQALITQAAEGGVLSIGLPDIAAWELARRLRVPGDRGRTPGQICARSGIDTGARRGCSRAQGHEGRSSAWGCVRCTRSPSRGPCESARRERRRLGPPGGTSNEARGKAVPQPANGVAGAPSLTEQSPSLVPAEVLAIAKRANDRLARRRRADLPGVQAAVAAEVRAPLRLEAPPSAT